MTPLGDVLETARRARGMTQEQLADAAGVSQAALSRYEHDLREPEADVLPRLAQALGVTPALLLHAGRVPGAVAVDAHMRRGATAPATAWRRAEARLNMTRLHARELFEEVSLRSDRTVPTFDSDDVTPETAARMVRMQWQMPLGPVRGLIAWMEAAGCLIVEEPLGPRVDGMCQWNGDHPVLLISSTAPTDRKRLTLAHELGHLVLHTAGAGIDPESEANAFASEFLMPIDIIRPQLRQLNLGRLMDLKREWGASMQALIERAYRSGALTAGERVKLYKQLGARGWRTREPGSDDLTPEIPRLSVDIAAALSSRGLTDEERATLAGFSSVEEMYLFQPQAPTLRRVR